jgi:ankyrin repeat protein
LEVLRHCLPSSVRRVLDDLPESLDETYERILREIRKPNQEHAHRLLQCLVAAVRPLRVTELAEVLAFDFNAVDAEGIPELNPDWSFSWENQEETIRSACSGLVTIVQDWDSLDSWTVQFSHFSVKEFLTANRLAEPIRDVSRYHIRLDDAHTSLVRACLGVLLQLKNIDITDFPLGLYAAECWTTHAQFEDVSSRIKNAIRCLFDADKPHFAIWDQLVPIRNRLVFKGQKTDHPFFYAVSFGFCDAAEYIITEHPERINGKGWFNQTPLHAAAEKGHTDILSLLLKHGADVNVRDLIGNTPLHQASVQGKVGAGRFLLDHGADINTRACSKITPLFAAVRNGHVEFARMLLERGAAMDVSAADRRLILLNAAVQSKKIQMVLLLLEYGEDVNQGDPKGWTPSRWASFLKQQEILELLSKHGAESVE